MLIRLAAVLSLPLIAVAQESAALPCLAGSRLLRDAPSQAEKVPGTASPFGEPGWVASLDFSRVAQPAFSEQQDGTHVAVWRVASADAAGLRLHLSGARLSPAATLRVCALDADGTPSAIAGPYRAAGPHQTGEFWTAALPAAEVFVELQVTGNAELPGEWPFEVDEVAHLTEAPAAPVAEAETPSPRETRTSLFHGVPVTHDIQEDGEAVVEGDILLGPADQLTAVDPKDAARLGVGTSMPLNVWPGGTVHYAIDPNLPNQARVTAAIQEWNTKLAGVIRLVPRTSQSAYVLFRKGGGCSSALGRTGYQQTINLADNCAIGNVIHEIGHAVGLFHEQSREDRNRHVSVLTQNLRSGMIYEFRQAPNSTADLAYYDYDSIMHYPPTAYSANGQPTTVTIPAGIPIGQRKVLSAADIAAVRQMYGKADLGVSSSTSPVTLTTLPAGLPLVVDGQTVATPATFQWSRNSRHTISAAATAGSSYGFVRWTDNGAATHTVTVGAGALTIGAIYRK